MNQILPRKFHQFCRRCAQAAGFDGGKHGSVKGICRKICIVHYKENTHMCCKNILRYDEKTECISVTLRNIIGMRFELLDT